MRKLFCLLPAFILAACGQESATSIDSIEEPNVTLEAPVLNTEPSNSYAEAYAAATAAIEIAGARGHAWTTSDQLMEDAKLAAASGDEDRAIILTDEARWHAQLAVIQADREALSWRGSVISDE